MQPPMDKRRKRFAPLDVYFAHGNTRKRLLAQFGRDGLLTWVCLLAAAKRANDQGTFEYVTEESGWRDLGLGHPFQPEYTLDAFFTFTGRLKKTRKTRRGQVTHVVLTGWGDWNKAWERDAERDKKARTRAQKAGDNAPTIVGQSPDITSPEYEYEREDEDERPDLTIWDLDSTQRRKVEAAEPVLVAAWYAAALNPPHGITSPVGWFLAGVSSGKPPQGAKKPPVPAQARFDSLRSFVQRFGDDYPNVVDLESELKQRGADDLMVQRLLKEAS